MSMNYAGYSFINAYLRGEEARLVRSEQIDRLLRVASIPEALDCIKGTDIGDYLGGQGLGTFDETDERLWQYLNHCIEQIKWFHLTPPEVRRLADAYAAKYDVMNTKAVLLSLANKRKAKVIPVGTLHRLGLTDELTKAADVKGIVNVLEMAGLQNYSGIVKDYQTDGGVEARLSLEASLDREYFGSFIRLARKMPEKTALLLVIGTMMDLTNLEIILRSMLSGLGTRVSHLLKDGYLISGSDMDVFLTLKIKDVVDRVPYVYQKVASEVAASLEKSKDIAAVDEIIDREKFRVFKEILSPRIMSPLTIVWYLIQKEAEVRDLRMIFKFIFDHHPLEEIRNYLVVSP